MKITINQKEANKIATELKCEISIWEKGGNNRAYVKSCGVQRGWIDLNTGEIHQTGDKWNEVPAVLKAMTEKKEESKQEENKGETFSMYSNGSESDVIITSDGKKMIMD